MIIFDLPANFRDHFEILNRLFSSTSFGRRDMIKSDKIHLIINTTEGRKAISDSSAIRSSAEQHQVYYTTTMAGGRAVCEAIMFAGDIQVRDLQTLHKAIS